MAHEYGRKRSHRVRSVPPFGVSTVAFRGRGLIITPTIVIILLSYTGETLPTKIVVGNQHENERANKYLCIVIIVLI